MSESDFSLNIKVNDNNASSVEPASSYNGTNSSTSVKCSLATNLTENGCKWCNSAKGCGW